MKTKFNNNTYKRIKTIDKIINRNNDHDNIILQSYSNNLDKYNKPSLTLNDKIINSYTNNISFYNILLIFILISIAIVVIFYLMQNKNK